MEITLEMGCEKTTHAMQTNSIYTMNEKAFYYFIWQTYAGFHGRITDKQTYNGIENVEIVITACHVNDSLPGACKHSSNNFEENTISVLSGQHGKVISLN